MKRETRVKPADEPREPWRLFEDEKLYSKTDWCARTGDSQRTADCRLASVPSALLGTRSRKWLGRHLNELIRTGFERGTSKVPPTGVVAARLAALREERARKREERQRTRVASAADPGLGRTNEGGVAHAD